MGIKYRKFDPTEYVMKVKKGKIVQQGLGLSFLQYDDGEHDGGPDHGV